MGARNRMTRDSLAGLTDEDFEAFLDDVAEKGLREACDARIWTQSATLNWIAASETRSDLYGRALKVRAELSIHEGREIVDGATPDDVGVAKLRSSWRQWEASKWNRDRYGERVQVDKTVTIAADAGLIGFAGELLARLSAPKERVVEAIELEAEAGEGVQAATPTGHLLPSSPLRQPVQDVGI